VIYALLFVAWLTCFAISWVFVNKAYENDVGVTASELGDVGFITFLCVWGPASVIATIAIYLCSDRRHYS
jgi:hypothetical protein